jgi:hypothetical protein
MRKTIMFLFVGLVLTSNSLWARTDTGKLDDGIMWDLTYVADNFHKAKCTVKEASHKSGDFTHRYLRVVAKDYYGKELIATVFRISREGLSDRELAYNKVKILEILRGKSICL